MAGGKRELIWLLRCALALTTCAPLKRDTVPVVYAHAMRSGNVLIRFRGSPHESLVHESSRPDCHRSDVVRG
jgi:hypothetical protein